MLTNSQSTKITLDVQGMKCAGCVKAVEKQLAQHPGVKAVWVNLLTQTAVCEIAGPVDQQKLADHLSQSGFPSQPRIGRSTPRPTPEPDNYLTVALLLLVGSGIGHIFHFSWLHGIWWHWAMATVAIAGPGRSLITNGFTALFRGNANMNTLIGIATCTAYISSCIGLFWSDLGWECYFDEPVMLLGFIFLGKTLESQAKARAAAAYAGLCEQQPATAVLICPDNPDSEGGIEIPVAHVRVGDWLRVKTGDKFPVDGTITSGTGLVDESMLSGESLPVVKQAGDQVFAGTINQSGVLIIQAQCTGPETVLGQIIALVEAAQTRCAPIQRFADQVAGYFTYAVITIALLTFGFWYLGGSRWWPELLVSHPHLLYPHATAVHIHPVAWSTKLAIATLVVACPCALGLATPTALLVGTSQAAQQGILIRGGDVLEKIHSLDTIVFDKTGTLTTGRAVVTDCLPLSDDLTPPQLLQLAASAESTTNHPLAEVIVQAARAANLPLLPCQDSQTIPGMGIKAIINGQTYYLGSGPWLSQNHYSMPTFAQHVGKSVVYVADSRQVIGLIACQDSLRPDAATTITQLHQMGLETMLLTGDQASAAEMIAKQAGIINVRSQLLPAEKVAIIKQLQAQGKTVAMVGDGLNDAAALAQADVGISLQGATDVAREAAGLILMHNSLKDLINALTLSQATWQKIKQNLLWAFAYNIIAIPLAAGVALPAWGISLTPSIAGAMMAFSSISVVLNSLGLAKLSQFKTLQPQESA